MRRSLDSGSSSTRGGGGHGKDAIDEGKRAGKLRPNDNPLIRLGWEEF